jgi:hypothetical protein
MPYMRSLSIVFRREYIIHTQLRFVLLDSFNFLGITDRKRSIASCDIRYERLFLLAKVKGGPLIGLIYNLNTLPASLFGEQNPVEIFHLSLDDRELTVSLTSLTALESKTHVSNLKDFFPLRLLHADDYQESDKEPVFEIQRNGKGKYIYNMWIRTILKVWSIISTTASLKNWKYLKYNEDIVRRSCNKFIPILQIPLNRVTSIG